jgi:energy-coupling factor transporter ATP-binding protein EcfA2
MSLLQIRDLTFHYPDGRHALLGVSLAVSAGERVALVGANGAGKSTLLLHLNGLLPGTEAYDHGHPDHVHAHGHSHGVELPTVLHRHTGEPAVFVDGLPAAGANLPEVRRRVGLLFQDPDDQLFCPTVLDDVAFGPLNLGLPDEECRRRAEEALTRVGLAGFGDRPPHKLSFGERKRACLAGVLACEPSLLALDEPSANLDPRARRQLIALLAGLPAAQIVATHDLEMALELCPRTVVLDKGRVVADGPTRTLLGDAALMDAHGLEVPLSLRLGRGPT